MQEPQIPCVRLSDIEEFPNRAPQFYYIRTEDNKLVPYTPNDGQMVLNGIIEEERKRTKELYGAEQIRLLVLKGRQVGISTDTGIRNMDGMCRMPMYNVQVLAHDDDTTQILYDIYKRAYDNLPEKIHIVDDEGNFVQRNYPFKPATKSLSGKRMEFSELESRLVVRTAGAGDNVGKGITLNSVHLSEVANYDHFNNVLSSTSQALPRNADVYCVLESTANGISGKGEGFYKLWETSSAEWERYQKGDTDYFDGYRPVFIPWYSLPKYSMDLRKGGMINLEGIDYGPQGKDKYLEKEEFMIEELGLSLPQVNWYRWCIKNKCSYSVVDAYRYYPTVPKDAFLATDNCFFDTNKLYVVNEDLKEKGEKDHVCGYINEDIEFIKDSTGEFKIWEMPDLKYENRYTIGVDPSRNVDGGDYGVIMVFDRLEEKFVAKWYGRMEEDQLALTAMRIGHFYNNALIVPESNLRTVINIIKPDGLVPYGGPLYHTQMGYPDKTNFEFGFYTEKKSRKDMLDEYKVWIREKYEVLADMSLVSEHINFVKKEKHGVIKPEAMEGEHDDQVLACALAVWGSEKWEEQIAEMNEDGDDYERFFQVEHSIGRKNKMKQSELGRKRKGYGFPNPDWNNHQRESRARFTQLGKR